MVSDVTHASWQNRWFKVPQNLSDPCPPPCFFFSNLLVTKQHNGTNVTDMPAGRTIKDSWNSLERDLPVIEHHVTYTDVTLLICHLRH